MHRLRRSIRPALLLAFAWLFGVATPLHCIVHCHLHPFLLSTAASDRRVPIEIMMLSPSMIV